MTRVYLPGTTADLVHLVSGGQLGPGPQVALDAHALTPAIREWYVEGDTEELEWVASQDAAHASLRRIAATGAAPRRVVLAFDVPDASCTPVAAGYRSSVRVSAVVRLAQVASVHLDEAAAEPAVRAAVAALAAADAGDEDAQLTVEAAGECDLLWYDPSELAALVEELQPGR